MTKNEDILVSINCITYNHGKYITDAIEGFLMQKTNFNFEILIHDDASTDETPEIIKKYEEKYPSIIKAIYQKENQYSKSIKVDYVFNFKRAIGKYIAECEGDDYWTDPYKLQKQVDYMENNPGCIMCFHPAKRITPDKKELGNCIGYFGRKNIICTMEDVGGSFLATASKIYVKSAMDNPPPFYFWGEAGDFPSQLIILDKGYGYYMNEVMAAYRVNVPGSSNERLRKKTKEQIIGYHKERIKILNAFNTYSNYKYSSYVKKIALKYELNIMSSEKYLKDRKLVLDRLKTNGYFELININKKVKIYSRCYLPTLYFKLVDFKTALKRYL